MRGPSPTRSAPLDSRSSILDLVAAFVLLLGHFLPWAMHTTAPLTRSGHDLSISTNFTPGAGIFLNEWFLLPLWSAAILIALIVSSSRFATRRPLRFVGFGLALVVASLGLPAYPHVLTAYADPDYRLQFFVTLGVFALISAIVFAGLPQLWLRSAVRIACALAAAVPLFGYFAVRPFIEVLYQSAVGVGIGWWFTLAGVLLLLAGAGAKISGRFAPKRVAQSSITTGADSH